MEQKMGEKVLSSRAGRAEGREPLPRMLRLPAASRYSGLSVWRLRQLILSGQLPAMQTEPNAPYLVDRDDLDRYLERMKRNFVA